MILSKLFLIRRFLRRLGGVRSGRRDLAALHCAFALVMFPDHRSPPMPPPVSPCWPQLGELRLSPERLDARNRGVGGSDANIILSGDPDRILRLWREKRGESRPEDLSNTLSVVLGSWTEAFNRQWYRSPANAFDPLRTLTA